MTDTDFKAANYVGDISPEQVNYLVADLNDQLYEKLGDDTILTFESLFNGYASIINWCGIQIWCSEDDDRPWLQDETGEDSEKGSLKEFIIEKMKYIKDKVSKIVLE